MNKIILTHYAAGEDTCDPVVETRKTIETLLRQMGPKMEKIGFQVIFREEPSAGKDDTESDRTNLITLACPDLGLEETPLEDLIGAESKMEDCSCGEGQCRSISLEGQSYQAVPPGLVTDGLLRVAFSAMEAMGGGGCNCCDCNGCGM